MTRLRLLSVTTTRPEVRRFVAHLQAFADPVHLGRWWRDAPDVFFERLPSLSEAQRHYFASWLSLTPGPHGAPDGRGVQ